MATQKLSVGDSFAVPLDGSFAVLQYAGRGHDAELVRVLPPVKELPDSFGLLQELVTGPHLYVIQGFLTLLLSQYPDSKKLGGFPLPLGAQETPAMIVSPRPRDMARAWIKLPEGGRSIRISEFRSRFPDVAVENLVGTEVPFPATMLACIRLGWRPSFGDQGAWLGAQSRERRRGRDNDGVRQGLTTRYFGFVGSRDAAQVVASALERVTTAQEVREIEGDGPTEWLVKLEAPGRPSTEIEEFFEAQLKISGGNYDGNEVGPPSAGEGN
jgi:hypothetical protein